MHRRPALPCLAIHFTFMDVFCLSLVRLLMKRLGVNLAVFEILLIYKCIIYSYLIERISHDGTYPVEF
jgi:hypothetical protein